MRIVIVKPGKDAVPPTCAVATMGLVMASWPIPQSDRKAKESGVGQKACANAPAAVPIMPRRTVP
jgi:hypothetical protein